MALTVIKSTKKWKRRRNTYNVCNKINFNESCLLHVNKQLNSVREKDDSVNNHLKIITHTSIPMGIDQERNEATFYVPLIKKHANTVSGIDSEY